MEGIDELFEEFSTVSEFQLAFAFETYVHIARSKSQTSKVAQRHHDKTPARRAYKRQWGLAYVKRRRAQDAQWAAKQRERQNRLNREYRDRKREQGKCARCPALQVSGKSMCQRHLEWERERRAA